jgi:sentrin-specific protease 1
MPIGMCCLRLTLIRTLAIIDIGNAEIRYYDSYVSGRRSGLGVLELMSQYVQDEQKKHGQEISRFQLKIVDDSPIQTDYSSCGVFTCLTAKKVVQGEELKFTQRDVQRYRMKMAAELCGFCK